MGAPGTPGPGRAMTIRERSILEARGHAWVVLALSLAAASSALAADGPEPAPSTPARQMLDYYERISQPKPLVARAGNEFIAHQTALRQRLLESVGLWPLPERVALEPRTTEALDHPWCTVRRVYYRLVPGVDASGLLYLPKSLPEKPSPAMLCPHGHWGLGNAHPVVHTRCLVFAHKGYVTFSPTQNHYEDLEIGVSHQTVGIWSNMRALDFLETLPEVDAGRIGVCGESGGGLQTQMLTALDPRVKAAAIAGLTCDFREITFPHAAHCDCNHYPAVMRFTDAPEISALGLPRPVQYLTMNDWTRRFAQDNFPAIAALYTANGVADHVQCGYEPTEHTYDRSKREKTYGWMDHWLKGREDSGPEPEPEPIELIPAERLQTLRLEGLKDDDFRGVSQLYRRRRHFQPLALTSRSDWSAYSRRMTSALLELTGESAVLLPLGKQKAVVTRRTEGEFTLEESRVPSEAALEVPTVILRRTAHRGRLPVVMLCSAGGAEELLKEHGPSSPYALAQQGALVVLPDARFCGKLSASALATDIGPAAMRFKPAHMLEAPTAHEAAALELARAWQRNALLWGRPLPAMTATDLRAVLNSVAGRADADMGRVRLVARGSGSVAIAVLFAAVLDSRVHAVDVDFQRACFENHTLPVVPFVLQYGDVLQWAAVLADREVVLHRLAAEAGSPAWLAAVFETLGRKQHLRID